MLSKGDEVRQLPRFFRVWFWRNLDYRPVGEWCVETELVIQIKLEEPGLMRGSGPTQNTCSEVKSYVSRNCCATLTISGHAAAYIDLSTSGKLMVYKTSGSRGHLTRTCFQLSRADMSVIQRVCSIIVFMELAAPAMELLLRSSAIVLMELATLVMESILICWAAIWLTGWNSITKRDTSASLYIVTCSWATRWAMGCNSYINECCRSSSRAAGATAHRVR